MNEVCVDTESWHSYPSIYTLGHKAVVNLLVEPVLVEEKVDGSQFSFGVFPGTSYGVRCRSKGAEINVSAPDNMFRPAVQTVLDLAPILTPFWTYRAEYLMKPKHNVLAYDRIPWKHLIVFDVNTGHEQYLGYDAKAAEAWRLGVSVVPRLFEGKVTDLQMFRGLLELQSCLGGQKIEGVVVKNYARFGVDKKVLMGKFVSEKYKEVHAREWQGAKASSGDIMDQLIMAYRTPARWQKALQHLRDVGKIEGSPRDIGPLIHEVAPDVEKECVDEIKAKLWAWAWPRLKRGLTAGLPEWYKQLLLEAQLDGTRPRGDAEDAGLPGVKPRRGGL